MAPNGDESAVRRLAKTSLLNWEPLDNPGVIKQLRRGERYFLTTRGMCDCGTENHADWIGLLVHWYGGNVTTEAIAAGNRRWLTLDEFTDNYLLNAEEDTLHTISLYTNVT
ncbi:MAG: hypothetical protein MUF23_01490 [Pirellula sp.]|jgi:hypothetical protein|nr:hypothetical protein [Pirellula sp.]